MSKPDIKVKFYLKHALRRGLRPELFFLAKATVGLVPNRGESVDISDWIDDFPEELDTDTCDRLLNTPLFVVTVHTVLKRDDEYVAVTLEFFTERRALTFGR